MNIHPLKHHSFKWITLPLAIVASCQQTKVAESPDARTEVVDRVIGYRADLTWPKRPDHLNWNAVPGVAVDADDNVWIFTRTDLPVQQYGPDGTLLRSWGRGLFEGPHGLRVDPDGHIWVTDTTFHIVQKFTPEGQLLMTLGVRGENGCDKNHFDGPTDIAFSPSGDIFVADGYGNSRVVHFDRKGNYINDFGSFGAEPGQFDIVHAIVCDSKTRLYIADRNNCRIQSFDPQGNLLGCWENIIQAWGLCVIDNDEIWACGTSPVRWNAESIKSGFRGSSPKDQLLIKFNPDGRVLQLWSVPLGANDNVNPGQCLWVHAIDCDSKGNLYLGDIQGKRAQKFVCVR